MKSNRRIFPEVFLSIILIFYILLIKTSNCNADFVWINKTGGVAGHKFTSLAVGENPNTIYLGSRGFLFKTGDGGKSWKSTFKTSGAGTSINSIVIDPKDTETVYIATDSGISKSVDGGAHWQSISLGAENVLALLLDVEDRNTLFAGTEKDIFITKDAGKNWVKSSEGLSGINVKVIAQDYIDCDILFASAANGLFKSEDRGRNWTKVFSTNIDDYDLNNEYEAESDDELLTSSAWVSIDPINPGIVYLATKNGIFKSEDSGNSWQRLPEAGLASRHIKNMVLPSYNRGYIFAATEEGVFRFSNEENMWKEFSSGLNSKKSVFADLNPQQETIWLATEDKVYKSEGNIYEIKEVSLSDKTKTVLQNFSHEPSYREIQEVAIEYAEVHPEKIAKWRQATRTKALLPKLSFRIDQDKGDYYYHGERIGEDEDAGWDITCSWDLGELVWNKDQTSIDVRSKLMVQLRDDILDEVTHLYFERRKLQIELMQNPPKDVDEFIEKELRLQELTAGIDAMTGGWLSKEIERRKTNLTNLSRLE